MRREEIDFDTVRSLALGLPEVKVSTAYGAPALKVRGKLLACIPTNKAAEPDSLAVSVDFDCRRALLADSPDIYYLPDHYVNYPIVLVRLGRIETGALEELLNMAWRFVTRR